MDFTDTQARICSIIENIHRENLTYLDESESLSHLADIESLNLPSLCYALCKDEKLIEENTNELARVVFWNMMVPRKFNTNKFNLLNSDDAFIKERPFFYQKLYWYEKA